jgi:endonuclease/exonuclease/phosphatase family metal-dependent hydrolase
MGGQARGGEFASRLRDGSEPAWREPIVLNRPPADSGWPLRVLVFNARSGVRLDAIVARLRRPPLAGANVLLLCELDWRRRRSHGREIAAELAAKLGMSFAYVPEFGMVRQTGPITSFFGNAILSAEPLEGVKAVPLPDGAPRRVPNRVGGPAGLIAAASFDRRRITLGVVHLNSRWNPMGRERQMAAFLAAFPPSGPAIIGGDFNTTTTDLSRPSAALRVVSHALFRPGRLRDPQSHEPLFDRLSDCGFRVGGANVPDRPTFTFSRIVPAWMRPKLDWIAVRGVEPMPGSAAVVAPLKSLLGPRFSDHDFVVCDVRL